MREGERKKVRVEDGRERARARERRGMPERVRGHVKQGGTRTEENGKIERVQWWERSWREGQRKRVRVEDGREHAKRRGVGACWAATGRQRRFHSAAGGQLCAPCGRSVAREAFAATRGACHGQIGGSAAPAAPPRPAPPRRSRRESSVHWRVGVMEGARGMCNSHAGRRGIRVGWANEAVEKGEGVVGSGGATLRH